MARRKRPMSVEQFGQFLDAHIAVQRYGHEMGLTKKQLIKLYRRGAQDACGSKFELQTYLERLEEMIDEENERLDGILAEIGA